MLRFKATGGGKSRSDVLPEGQYEAALLKVEEARNSDGPYLRWSFEVSRQGEGYTVTGLTPAHLEPGSKAIFWSEALLGRPLQGEEEIDLEKLYGRPCRIELTVVVKDGREFNKIARVEKTRRVTLTARKAPEPLPGEENFDDGQGAF